MSDTVRIQLLHQLKRLFVFLGEKGGPWFNRRGLPRLGWATWSRPSPVGRFSHLFEVEA